MLFPIKMILLISILKFQVLQVVYSQESEEQFFEEEIEEDCILNNEQNYVLKLSENEIVNLSLLKIFEEKEYQQFESTKFQIIPEILIENLQVSYFGPIQKFIPQVTSNSIYNSKIIIKGHYFYIYDVNLNELEQLNLSDENHKFIFIMNDLFIDVFQEKKNNQQKTIITLLFKEQSYYQFDMICQDVQFFNDNIYCFYKQNIQVLKIEKNLYLSLDRYDVKKTFNLNDLNYNALEPLTQMKVYRNEQIFLLQDRKILHIDQKDNMKKQLINFDSTIITYDYDVIQNQFAIVLINSIKYKQYVYPLDIDIKYPEVEIYVLKNYILLKLKNNIEIYSKTLQKISTHNFDNPIILYIDPDKDGFLYGQSDNLWRVTLNEKPYFKIDSRDYNFDLISENIQLTQTHKSVCKFNIIIKPFFNDEIINALMELKHSSLISVRQQDFKINYCEPINRKKTSKNVLKLLSKIDAYLIYFKSFYFSELQTWIISINQENQIRIYDCQASCIEKYFQIFETPFDERNFFIFLKMKQEITFIIMCQQDNCLLLKFSSFDQILLDKQTSTYFESIQSIIIIRDQIYYLESDQIHFTHLENFLSFPFLLTGFPKANQIFASPFNDNYYIIVLDQTFFLYYIFNTKNSVKLVYQETFGQIIKEVKFFIFEKYFVLLGKITETEFKFIIYNYENLINVYIEKTINLDYFQEISLFDVEESYHNNIIYIKGYLRVSNYFVMIAYKINTLVSQSIQFIYKIQDEQILITIQKNSISIKESDQYINLVMYKNQNFFEELIENSYVCYSKSEQFYDEFVDLESDEDVSGSYLDLFPTTFVATSALEELLIYGMYKIYGKKKMQFYDSEIV